MSSVCTRDSFILDKTDLTNSMAEKTENKDKKKLKDGKGHKKECSVEEG